MPSRQLQLAHGLPEPLVAPIHCLQCQGPWLCPPYTVCSLQMTGPWLCPSYTASALKPWLTVGQHSHPLVGSMTSSRPHCLVERCLQCQGPLLCPSHTAGTLQM